MSIKSGGISTKLELKGLKRLDRRLDGTARRQMPFAASTATNGTLFKIMAAERKAIEHVFDRPKTFTIKSQKVKKATKKTLSGVIWIKDRHDITTGTPPGVYLARQIKGSTRPEKAFTRSLVRAGLLPHGLFAVPAKSARLDKFGNITPGMHRKILTALKAKSGPYFIPRPGQSSLPLGIYRRMARRKVKALFIFTKKQPSYKPRFNFASVAVKTFKQNFNSEFVKALHRALRTAR